MTTSRRLVNEIRAAANRVVAGATRVTLDRSQLDQLASRLWSPAPLEHPTSWTVSGGGARNADSSLLAAALAYGSGCHDRLTKEPGLSGAQTNTERLRIWYERDRPTAATCQQATVAGMARIMRQDGDDPATHRLMASYAGRVRCVGDLTHHPLGQIRPSPWGHLGPSEPPTRRTLDAGAEPGG